MRYLNFAAFASVAALSVAAAPAVHAQADANMPMPQGSMMGGSYTRDMMMSRNDSTGANSIAAVAMSDPQFSTLVKLVKIAGLDNSLMYRGPLTVFAPTNDAFDKLPKGTLRALMMPENLKVLQGILMYHIIPGGYNAADVTAMNGQMLPTTARMMPISVVAGPALSYGGGAMGGSTAGMSNDMMMKPDMMPMMGTARIVRPDIMASNGVIHVIDTVLLPPMDPMARMSFMKSVKMARMEDKMMMKGMKKDKSLMGEAMMGQKSPGQMSMEKPLGGSAMDPAPAKP